MSFKNFHFLKFWQKQKSKIMAVNSGNGIANHTSKFNPMMFVYLYSIVFLVITNILSYSIGYVRFYYFREHEFDPHTPPIFWTFFKKNLTAAHIRLGFRLSCVLAIGTRDCLKEYTGGVRD